MDGERMEWVGVALLIVVFAVVLVVALGLGSGFVSLPSGGVYGKVLGADFGVVVRGGDLIIVPHGSDLRVSGVVLVGRDGRVVICNVSGVRLSDGALMVPIRDVIGNESVVRVGLLINGMIYWHDLTTQVEASITLPPTFPTTGKPVPTTAPTATTTESNTTTTTNTTTTPYCVNTTVTVTTTKTVTWITTTTLIERTTITKTTTTTITKTVTTTTTTTISRPVPPGWFGLGVTVFSLGLVGLLVRLRG